MVSGLRIDDGCEPMKSEEEIRAKIETLDSSKPSDYCVWMNGVGIHDRGERFKMLRHALKWVLSDIND